MDFANLFPQKNRLKLSSEDLNLWKLGHTSIVHYFTCTVVAP